MDRLLSPFYRMPIVRFASVGAVSTVLDVGVLNLAYRLGLPTLGATALGFLVGATNGYLLNSALVFDRKPSYQRYAKYFLISLGGLLLTELIIYQLNVREGLLSLNLAKLVAIGLVFSWNFTLSRRWAFK